MSEIRKLRKIGKYDIYVDKVSPKNEPQKSEWHVTAHDTKVMRTSDVGYYSTEADAWNAAEKFAKDNP